MLDALEHSLNKAIALFRFFVFLRRQHRTHRQDLLRFENRILLKDLKERLNKQTGANQQHERKCDFKNDQRAAQATS